MKTRWKEKLLVMVKKIQNSSIQYSEKMIKKELNIDIQLLD